MIGRNRGRKTLLPFALAAVLLALFCASAAAETDPAEARSGRVGMILCGGDNDHLEKPNNLFVQQVHGSSIREQLYRAEFIPSAFRDYSNESARERAEIGMRAAEGFRRDGCGRIAVAAYSHGGMTAFYMDYADIDCLIMLDAVVYIRGLGNDEQIIAAWLERLLEIGGQKTDILFFFSHDPMNGASFNANELVELLRKRMQDPEFRGPHGETIEEEGEDCCLIRNPDGEAAGRLLLIGTDGRHGQLCVDAAERIAALIEGQPVGGGAPSDDFSAEPV